MTYRRTPTAARMTATSSLYQFVRDARVNIMNHPQIDMAVTYAPKVKMAQAAVDDCSLSGEAEEAVNALVAASIEAALAVGWHLARNPESLLFEDERR